MSAPGLDIRVECYAGHRGDAAQDVRISRERRTRGSDEEPRRFWFGERAIEVTDILDRWLAPEYRYFKVRGDDGATYILRHDTRADRWELTMFESRPR